MTKQKYIMSGGLAFSESKDMEKLRKYSLKGWHLSGFSFLGYTLTKGIKKDYIYNLDYHSITPDEKEEYFNLFSTAGWTHVTSIDDIHLFRASPGTSPIYTDSETSVQKYERSCKSTAAVAIPVILITAAAWILALSFSGTAGTVLMITAAVLSVIAVPAAMTLAASWHSKWKAEGKRIPVLLIKIIPFVIVLTATSVLLSFNSLNSSVELLVYMTAGAVGFPAVLCMITSIYLRVKRD